MSPCARIPLLLGFTLVVRCLHAQNQLPDQKTTPAHQQQTSAIEGHVLCEDTRSPARLATVLLIPITVWDASGKATSPKLSRNAIARTNLEGNYTLPKIPPGDYFVLAELRGYLSPVTQFRWTELQEPTPDSIKKLATLLPSVHVEPGKTARADIIIQRGASISGKVTYDDGTPAIGAFVYTEPIQDAPGRDRHIAQRLSVDWALVANDRGSYRIDGLPEGEYVVEAQLDSHAAGSNPLADGDDEPDPDSFYGQVLDTTYAERTLHKKSAKVYKLSPSEDLSGVDIEIPVHGLYSISGTVAAQGNQPPIVFGFVSLEDVDDKTFTRRAVIHSDLSFEFSYLPPAKYRLKTVNVSDQSPIHFSGQEPKPSYTYPEASRVVEIIDQNLSSVTLAIPEVPTPSATPQKESAGNPPR